MTSQKYLGNKIVILSSLLILALIVVSGILLSSMLLHFQLPRAIQEAQANPCYTSAPVDLEVEEDFRCDFEGIGSLDIEEESATLTVCKEVDFSSSVDFSFTVTGNGPSPAQLLLGDGDCVDVTIGPGGYTVTENNPSPFTFITGNCVRDPNNSRSATGEIQAGETQECNFRNGTD